jgi:hypothetical protein
MDASLSKRVSLAVVIAVFGSVGCATPSRAPGAATKVNPGPQASAANDATYGNVTIVPIADAEAHVDGTESLVAVITSPCVLHTSDVTSRKHQYRLPNGVVRSESPKGNCFADAECVRKHGEGTTGDGFLRLKCKERSCTCEIESLASNAEPKAFAFELLAPCTTSEQAFDVLVDRCMKGMTVVGRN